MIKLIDTKIQFEIVSEYDDAVDLKAAKKVGDDGKSPWDRYLETLDSAIIPKTDPQAQLSFFVVRPLLNKERAAIEAKYYRFNAEEGKTSIEDGAAYFAEIFSTCCLGLKASDGSVTKLGGEDLPMEHTYSLGSSLVALMSLGKHLKNV